jgi:hypothetical protein
MKREINLTPIKTAKMDAEKLNIVVAFEDGEEAVLFSGHNVGPEEVVGKTLHEAWSLKFHRDIGVSANLTEVAVAAG